VDRGACRPDASKATKDSEGTVRKKVLQTQPDSIVEEWKYSGVTGYHRIPPKSTTLPSSTLNKLVTTVENIQIVRKARSSITHAYLKESFRY